jgi:hypothetical protein
MKIQILKKSLRPEVEDCVGKRYADETMRKFGSRIRAVLDKIQPELDALAASVKGVAEKETIKMRVYNSQFPDQDCEPRFGLAAESNKADLSSEMAYGSILLVEGFSGKISKAIARATGLKAAEIEINWERSGGPSWLGIPY